MSRAKGHTVEQYALKFLKKNGLSIVTTNYHSRFGEIDIIAKDYQQLIIIEVRHRQHHHFGSSLESITLSKQRKIIQTTLYFLLENTEYQSWPIRFDVMASDQNQKQFQWIQGAFDANIV